MKKSAWILGAAAVCTAVLLTGCGKEPEKETELTTLEWYVNFSWYSTTWGDNMVSRAITEETGTSIDFIAPNGSEKEKINAMIASDTLPDLVTLGWWEEEYQTLIEQEKVYALNELADEYCPEFYDVVNEMTAQWYTAQDGSLYAYPNSSYTPEDVEQNADVYSNQNFLVRKDIYEALGCPDMTTPEGFQDAVRRAAEAFPEVDGQPLIPIGADEFTENGCNSFDGYLKSFLAVPYEQDGQYYDRNLDADYLEWLRVFRQMKEEGYLMDDIFVDKRQQLEDKISIGQYFCLFYQNIDIAVPQKILNQTYPERTYIAVDGPKNADGDDPVLPVSGIHGWTVTLIPKTCKDPEAAIRLLTYLLSEEGQKMTYLGVEGEMYEMTDGQPEVRQEVLELLNQDRVAYDEKYGADNTYWMLQNNAMQYQWEYENAEDPILQLKQYTIPYVAYTGQYDLDFLEDEENARRYAAMKKLWGSTLESLLLAEDEEEFDLVLQNYKKEREEVGYEAFAQAAESQYRENKKKLGFTDE